VKEKIQAKINGAKMWKSITLICVLILVVSFFVGIIIKNDITKFILGASGIATIVSLIVFFGFRNNILKCMKILEEAGITLDEVAKDLEGAKTIGKVRKVVCGDKFFTLPSPFCVFSYKEILWVYLKKTTTHDGSTGATTTSKTVIFCTAHGKKFSANISWKVAKEFLEENREKFLPELIVGYKMKYNKQYKELVKKYK